MRVYITDSELKTDQGSKLLDLCLEITRDGKIDLDEIKALRAFLRANKEKSPVKAVSYLNEIMDRITADKTIDKDELAELHAAIERVIPVAVRTQAIQARKKRTILKKEKRRESKSRIQVDQKPSVSEKQDDVSVLRSTSSPDIIVSRRTGSKKTTRDSLTTPGKVWKFFTVGTMVCLTLWLFFGGLSALISGNVFAALGLLIFAFFALRLLIKITGKKKKKKSRRMSGRIRKGGKAPTEKQIAYAETLGIEVYPGMSRSDVSQAIDKKLDSNRGGSRKARGERKNNIRRIQKDESILFIDVETSDLPRNFNAPASDLDNWPRIVQFAWILSDTSGNIFEEHCRLVKPIGFRIAKGAYERHGISTEFATENGEILDGVIEDFQKACQVSKVIVAHNVSFDVPVIASEFIRAGKKEPFRGKSQRCTMKESTDYCEIPGNYGNKWPTLGELHQVLFDQDFDNAHDALADCRACMTCFLQLNKIGIMN